MYFANFYIIFVKTYNLQDIPENRVEILFEMWIGVVISLTF